MWCENPYLVRRRRVRRIGAENGAHLRRRRRTFAPASAQICAGKRRTLRRRRTLRLSPHFFDGALCGCDLTAFSQRPRMTELAFATLRTFVRLGEAVPMVFFSSAGDFILPVNCRRSTTAVRAASGTAGKMNSPEAEPRHAAPPAACRPACRGSASGESILPAVPDAARTAVVDRRQLTGKMKSTALGIGMSGTASPRRTIVLSLAKANSVILGRR